MSSYEMGGMHFGNTSQVETYAPVLTFDSFADRTERHYAQAQIVPRDDFDPYSHHNDQTPDPILEQYADISLNEPLPEKFPDLSTSELDIAQSAVKALTKFSESLSGTPSAESLNELTKLLRDQRVRPDVIDAINMMLDKAGLKPPVRLGLSELTGLICLGIGGADGHFNKLFFVSDNRGVKR